MNLKIENLLKIQLVNPSRNSKILVIIINLRFSTKMPHLKEINQLSGNNNQLNLNLSKI